MLQVLDELNEEIDTVLEEFNGKVNTDTIQDMPYLDACIKETLRISGPAARSLFLL